MGIGDLIEKFRGVALDRIERMNLIMVALERDPDDASSSEEILREIHTLKGEAKMMGFADINLVAHQTESLLISASKRDYRVDAALVDCVFEGLDLLRLLLTKRAGTSDAPIDITGFNERSTVIIQVLERPAEPEPSSEPRESMLVEDSEDISAVSAPNLSSLAFAETSASASGPPDPREIEDLLRESPKEDALDQGVDPSPPTPDDSYQRAYDTPRLPRRMVRTSAKISKPSAKGFSDEERESSTVLKLQTENVLRVRLERLERLGSVASEALLIHKRMDYHMRAMQDVRDELKAWVARVGDALPKSHQASLREVMHNFEKSLSTTTEDRRRGSLLSSQLDEEVRSLRHVPLAQSVSHYPRAVRDLAQAQGKRVRFSLEIGNIEVDRPVLTTLADPLLHLVRNAVDHGIETPDQRIAANKEPEAKIRLSVEHVGDGLRVVLSDDGRGIDPDFMIARALDKGIISPSQAEGMDDQEALGLIFTPGFSTKHTVSDVSGRGIGMDVVLRHITNAGGNIEVTSETGEGTTFTLRVPLSSVVVSALLVRIGERVFGFHAKDIERVLDAPRSAIRRIHGFPCVRDEDGTLIELLDWHTALDQPTSNVGVRPVHRILMLNDGPRTVGVPVDEVLGERQALNRPLGEFLRGVRMCRGVALTDAGEIIPLLNVVEMLARSQRSEPIALRQTLAGDAPTMAQSGRLNRSYSTVQLSTLNTIKTVLVAEDSEITRALVTGILRGLGYRVIEADDGQMAWEMLQEHRVHLLMTDVQMPRMSGLELLSNVRADPRFEGIPAIVLSTLGSDEDKERALRLGADSYLVKLDFREKDLISTVQRYLS